VLLANYLDLILISHRPQRRFNLRRSARNTSGWLWRYPTGRMPLAAMMILLGGGGPVPRCTSVSKFQLGPALGLDLAGRQSGVIAGRQLARITRTPTTCFLIIIVPARRRPIHSLLIHFTQWADCATRDKHLHHVEWKSSRPKWRERCGRSTTTRRARRTIISSGRRRRESGFCVQAAAGEPNSIVSARPALAILRLAAALRQSAKVSARMCRHRPP
jgi:hypothetical protein